MRPEVVKFLQVVSEACEVLFAFTQGKSFEDYGSDRLLRAEVEREFITIGEALLQASKLDSSFELAITDLQLIIGIREVESLLALLGSY